jgi:hypothetical protein
VQVRAEFHLVERRNARAEAAEGRCEGAGQARGRLRVRVDVSVEFRPLFAA